MKTAVLFISIVFTACTTRTENLVVNPDAETPPLDSGWVQLSGRWQQRAKSPLPQAGKTYFFAGAAANAELYQDVDVSSYANSIDRGLVSFTYSSYMRSWPQRPADQAIEVIEYRSADSIVLDSFKTEPCVATNEWMPVLDHRKAPEGTRIVRIRLLAKRFNGSNNDGYHDNISLTLEKQTPLYLVLILIIAALVFIAIAYRILSKKYKKKEHRGCREFVAEQ